MSKRIVGWWTLDTLLDDLEPAEFDRRCTRHDRRPMALTDDVRAACARVAERARQVRIVAEAIEPYARTLPSASSPAPDLEPGATDEARAAYSLQLNAINFGSGWFPTLRKPPGLSGFRTVEAALRRRGPWNADELAASTPRGRGRRWARTQSTS